LYHSPAKSQQKKTFPVLKARFEGYAFEFEKINSPNVSVSNFSPIAKNREL
jgi:hypothetical protein